MDDYVRSRPGYPRQAYDLIAQRCGLAAEHVVADVGSGTGLCSKLFLDNGHVVCGVEPNGPMREAGERFLSAYGGRFVSVEGTAEATGLADDGVDLVVAAQAFHWFEPDAARREFARILRAPDGSVVLLWNDRDDEASELMRAYEALVRRHATDYAQVDHRNVHEPERLAAFFGTRGFEEHTLRNEQRLDLAGFLARIRSCSYLPAEGEPGHDAMVEETVALFDRHRHGDRVTLLYTTRLYLGTGTFP